MHESLSAHEKNGRAECVLVHESVTTHKDGLFRKKHLLHNLDSIKPRSRKEASKSKTQAI
jgi:hypothetical protein